MRRISTLLFLFSTLIASAQVSQGLNTSDVQQDVANGAALQAWQIPANAATDDGQVSSVAVNRTNQTSRYLKLTDFDFNIPASATVTGITVSFKSRFTINSGFVGSLALINENATITSFTKPFNSSNSIESATNFATASFGGSSDLWNSGFTPSTVNDVDFGVALEVHRDNNGNQTTNFFVDVVSIAVSYTVPLAVATADNYGAATLAQVVSGNVLSNDTDPNGGSLSAAVVTPPSTGTLDLTTSGAFTYTPPATGFAGGTITFTYTATSSVDASTTSSPATVTLNYPEGTVTPVNFRGFDAKKLTAGTQLTWKVGAEDNVSHYEIERNDGSLYRTIGTVKAVGLANYSFIDPKGSTGTILYRIRSVDNDGKYKYSTIISLNNGTASIVLKAFPLPAINTLTVQHPVVDNGQIVIAGSDGRALRSVALAKGSMQTDIKLDGLTTGVYLLRFSTGNGQPQTIKIVKQ